MKKILMLMVSATIVFCGVFTSCDKDDTTPEEQTTPDPDPDPEPEPEPEPEDTTPTITWAANPDFEPYDIGSDDIDLDIIVDAPNGIETFTLNINTDNASLNMLLKLTGVTTNTDIDIINGDLVDMLKTLGINCGTELYGATTAEFDVTDLISLMVTLAGDSAFTVTMDLAVTDSEGQTVKKTLSLYVE